MRLFWICAGNSACNTGKFSLQLSSAYTGMRPFTRRRHSWDSWPQPTKGIFHTIKSHAQHIKLVEERLEWWHSSSQAIITCNHYMRWSPAFLEMAEHLPDDGKLWINYWVCFAFAYLLNSLSQFTSFLNFTVPPSHRGGVIEQLRGV